jgi:hypothetical protein
MAANQPVFGAFGQGARPTIAVFNDAATPLGVDFDKLIAAMQKYVDHFVAPVWGTPAKLVKSAGFIEGAWAMVFLDDADTANALAYHDLTPDGLPQSKVFVRTTIKDGELVSVSATHELVEMLVDPAINLLSTGPEDGVIYAYESADPVEALSFDIDGIQVSDFVHPAYFEAFRAPRSVKFDHMERVEAPFQILEGGYQIIFRQGQWVQVFGSAAKARAFAREDRIGHRSETRRVYQRFRSVPPAGRHLLSVYPDQTGSDTRVATGGKSPVVPPPIAG